MKCLRIHIYGRVQHIGFRFTAMQVAYQRGIRGYIQNQKDGSLIVEAEGEEEKLQEFVEWCKRGPVWAKVNNITVEETEPKNYTSFEILH